MKKKKRSINFSLLNFCKALIPALLPISYRQIMIVIVIHWEKLEENSLLISLYNSKILIDMLLVPIKSEI